MNDRGTAVERLEARLTEEKRAAEALRAELDQVRMERETMARERGDAERQGRDLASAQSALERELADMQAAHEHAISELRSVQGHKLDEFQSSHERELDEIRRAHEQKLSEAHAARERDMAELEAAARREVAAISTELENLRASVARAAVVRTSPAPAKTPMGPVDAAKTGGPGVDQGDDAEWQPVRLDTRYLFPEDMQIRINGESVKLCDLSTSGSQVISQKTLRPGQVVTVQLPLDESDVACSGTVVWARTEAKVAAQPPSCRVGIRFAKADTTAIEAFVIRYAIPT